MPGRDKGAISMSSRTHCSLELIPGRSSPPHVSQASRANGDIIQYKTAILTNELTYLASGKPALTCPAGLFRTRHCRVSHPIWQSPDAEIASYLTKLCSSPCNGTSNGRIEMHVTGKSWTSGNVLTAFHFWVSHSVTSPPADAKAMVAASPAIDMDDAGCLRHGVRSMQT